MVCRLPVCRQLIMVVTNAKLERMGGATSRVGMDDPEELEVKSFADMCAEGRQQCRYKKDIKAKTCCDTTFGRDQPKRSKSSAKNSKV